MYIPTCAYGSVVYCFLFVFGWGVDIVVDAYEHIFSRFASLTLGPFYACHNVRELILNDMGKSKGTYLQQNTHNTRAVWTRQPHVQCDILGSTLLATGDNILFYGPKLGTIVWLV